MRNVELKVHCENEERFQALEIQAQKGEPVIFVP